MPQVSFDQSTGLYFIESLHRQRNKVGSFRAHRAYLPFTGIPPFGSRFMFQYMPTPGKTVYRRMHCRRYVDHPVFTGDWYEWEVTLDPITCLPSIRWILPRALSDIETIFSPAFGEQVIIGGMTDYLFDANGLPFYSNETGDATHFTRTLKWSSGPDTITDIVECTLSQPYTYEDLVTDLNSLLSLSYAHATDKQTYTNIEPSPYPEKTRNPFTRNTVTRKRAGIIQGGRYSSFNGFGLLDMTAGLGTGKNLWNPCGWSSRTFGLLSPYDSSTFDTINAQYFYEYDGSVVYGTESIENRAGVYFLHAGTRCSGVWPPPPSQPYVPDGTLSKMTLEFPFPRPAQLRRDYFDASGSPGAGTCEDWDGSRIISQPLIATTDTTTWPDGYKDSYVGFRRNESCS
jgi:hypothetical protein